MLSFIKPKKKKFILARPAPAVFGKRTNPMFDLLSEKYGSPEYDAMEGMSQIVNGRVIFPNGKQFIRDAKTGDILEYTKDVRYIGMSRGLHFYIREDHDLLIGDHAIPSFPRRNGE